MLESGDQGAVSTADKTANEPAGAVSSAANGLGRTPLFSVVELGISGALLVFTAALVVALHRPEIAYLFGYSFVGNLFVALVPHEPGMIYFGKIMPPVLVATVGGAATLVAAILDYRLFNRILHAPRAARLYQGSELYRVARAAFCKAPFLTVALAGFLPLPYSPFKFLAISAGYAEARYVTAVCTGRTPRYYVLAAIGKAYKVPTSVLVAFLVAMAVLAAYSSWHSYRHSRPRSD